MSESGDLLKAVGAVKMYLIVSEDSNSTWTHGPIESLGSAKMVLQGKTAADAVKIKEALERHKKDKVCIVEGYFIPEKKL